MKGERALRILSFFILFFSLIITCGKDKSDLPINHIRLLDEVQVVSNMNSIEVIRGPSGFQKVGLSPDAYEITDGIDYTIVGIPGGNPCTAVQTGGLWRTCCNLQITNNTGLPITGVVLIGWQALSGSPEAGRTGGNNSGYDGSGTGWRTTDGSTPNPSANGGWTLWIKDDDATIETIENGATSDLRSICIQSPTGYSISLWRLFSDSPSGRITNSSIPPNSWAKLTNSTELGNGNYVIPDPDGYFVFPEITLTNFIREVGAECTPKFIHTGTEVFITVPLNTTYRDYIAELQDDAGINIDKYMWTVTPNETVSLCSGAWTGYRYVNSLARCVNDDANKNGIIDGSDDTSYRVAIRTADPTKVLLFLDYGGACYQHGTTLYQGCSAQTVYTTSFYAPCPAIDNGIFDLPDPRNPFTNWSIVYASYCDGSVFSGDNDPIYSGTQYYHRGMRNLSAAVTLMKGQFPDAQMLAVAGSSGGSYGTLLASMLVRTQYPDCTDVENGNNTANLFVINDSGHDIENLTPNISSQGYQMRQKLRDGWQVEKFFPPVSECENPACCWWRDIDTSTNDQIAYLFDWMLDRDSKVRIGFISYLQDPVMGGGGIYGGGFLFFNSATQYRDCALVPTTTDLNAFHPSRFKRFFYNASEHVMLTDTDLYNRSISGIFLYQWVNNLLNNPVNWNDLVAPYTPGTCTTYTPVMCSQ